MNTATLKDLKPGEKVDRVIRRHWIVFIMVAIYALWGVILTIILFSLFGFTALASLWVVIFWMYYSMFLYISWLNHELDLIVVTNNRVVVVEQRSFLDRDVWETTLDKIQEAGVRTKWLFANLLDYGTLTLKTAGSTTNFDMTFCPKPMECSRYMNNVVDSYRDAHSYQQTTEKREKEEVTPEVKVRAKVLSDGNIQEGDIETIQET